MANLLAHALAALAFCGMLNLAFGLPPITWGIFAAGLLAMLIELDLDDLSENHRSPVGHSLLFGIVWIVIFSAMIWIVFTSDIALGGTLAIISAFTTHLSIDLFTKEGIYTFPRGKDMKKWITRLSEGERKCWGNWRIFQSKRIEKVKRGNDDPILNAIISVPSLLAIIVFVAMMPVPL
jgi:hypothetical protein